MLLEPHKAELVVMVVVCLHNFLRRSTSRNIYTPPSSLDTDFNGHTTSGSWRNDQQGMAFLLPLKNVHRRTKLIAEEIREKFIDYFCTIGRIPWQNQYA